MKTGSKCFNYNPGGNVFLCKLIQLWTVDRQQKHDLGYWMTVIGFTSVVSGAMFGSYIGLEIHDVLGIIAVGLTVFAVGAEMALRNSKHRYPFHHED